MGSNIDWRSRLIAAAIHFFVTLLIAGGAAAIIFFVWFPGELAKMVGGTQLFLLVVCSDLILGPLISLVIFNKKKSRKELVVDYLIIGVIQLSALIYGVSVVALSRPVFIAFTKDRFEVVTAIELDDADLSMAADARYKLKSWLGPVLVSIEFPTDTKERNELLFSAVNGKDAQLMPKYYRPYESMVDAVREKSESLDSLISRHKESQPELEATVKQLGRSAESLRCLPVRHRFGFWTVLIDTKTGYPVKYLPIDPY